MANKTLVARYSDLVKAIKEHEGAIEELKVKADALKEQLLAQMQRDGISKISCDGLTHYIQTQYWAGRAEGVEAQEACNALKAAGYEEFVQEKFSTQSLSAYVREGRKLAAAEYPDDKLAGEDAAERWTECFIRDTLNTIKITEKIELRSRKAS